MREFDYVIVGAGSAGCVLAGRLSEDPAVEVLLLEAGPSDRHLSVRVPLAFGNQFHGKRDWDLATDPEPHCANRELYVPRGRQLGGSSSMNAMLYVRGRPLDYDLWADWGAEGWGWTDVLPYFLKAENNERGESEFHAVGGPLNVADQRNPQATNATFLAAAEAAGIPYVADYNGPEQDGASMFQVTQRGGRRFSAADAYVKPVIKRPNLTVQTGVHVLGIELDGDHATGVRYRMRGGGERVVRPARDTILSAGAIGSPQLLMLSGIGPPDHLREVGIEVRHELRGVGQNLQDHPFATVLFEIDDERTLYGADKPKHLAEWLLRHSGKLTSVVAEACAFVRTRPGLPAPDVQFHAGPAFYEDHGATEFDGHAYTIAPTLLAPKSRGWVKLRSADPGAKPRILTNSLAEADDVTSLVAGMELARRIAATEPFASMAVRELRPGADVDDLEASLRERVELLYHPVGTCRMGAPDDDLAVLDPHLRVRGLTGLRVIDASAMPVIPGGNTNAPTIMLAERAADLIRERVPVA